MAANQTQQKTVQFDEVDLDEVPTEESTTGRRHLFTKELRRMMYGFGDDQNPYTESVDLLEDLVIKYMAEITRRAMQIGSAGQIREDDIFYLYRKDACKYSRGKNLLAMNQKLMRARKAFDDCVYAQAETQLEQE
ncbi:transcription initiation factor TFIID subunit 13-like [Sabethes cyaneus]|uniref:transcription initiation factor TFIID subunit 13-like n=1 Tax=Sabethes cyaneus TaxID=53552 RepID=UPI00237E6C2E|nr:transcription initiation factor TFIID subunit 13-like [Sabethes cyaneus]